MSSFRRYLGVSLVLLIVCMMVHARPIRVMKPMEIYPQNPVVKAGQTLRFTVVMRTSRGCSYTPSVMWYASGGRIDSYGTFQAGRRPGWYSVTAKFGRIQVSTRVQVRSFGSSISRIVVAPQRIRLAIGQRFNFRALAYNRVGRIVAFRPFWQTTGGGHINQAGVFTAQYAGNYTITAKSRGGVYGTSVVHVYRYVQPQPQPHPHPYPHPYPQPNPSGRIVVSKWDIGGNIFKRKAKILVTVYGRRAQTIKLFSVTSSGRYQELQAHSCRHKATIFFKTKFMSTKYLEIRLYDNMGQILARYRRAAN